MRALQAYGKRVRCTALTARKGTEKAMIATIIFSNTYWTFWDLMLLFFVWIPLIMVWFFCMLDVFRRQDLSGWGKALWVLAILVLPWIGSLGYLIFHPWDDNSYAPSY